MKVEQEQRVTEDGRHFAEQEVAAQKYAVHVLQVLLFYFLCFSDLYVVISNKYIRSFDITTSFLKFLDGSD